MNFWGSFYSNEIFIILQGLFLILVFYYAWQDIRQYSRKAITFSTFNEKKSLFEPHYSFLVSLLRSSTLLLFFMISFMFLFSGAWPFSLILLLEMMVLVFTMTLEETSNEYSLYLSEFNNAHKQLDAFRAKLNDQLESLQNVIQTIQTDRDELSSVDGKLLTVHPELTLQDSIEELTQIVESIETTLDAMNIELEKSIVAFNRDLMDYVENQNVIDIQFATSFPLPIVQDELRTAQKIKQNSITNIDTKLLQLLSKTLFTLKQYLNLTSVFVELKLPISKESIQLIVNQLPDNANLDDAGIDEIVINLYKHKWLDREIILHSLEQSLFYIINRGIFSHLSKQEIVDILQLLISQDSRDAMTRFLRNMPKERFELLYVIPRINANHAGQLALQFREFSPLKYEFTDESNKYYSMYQALVNSGHQFTFQREATLGETILRHSGVIASTYQESFDKLEDLLTYMESIKLILLTSDIQSSSVIRVSAAIELVYEYLVNLKRRPTEVLLQYIESIFLQSETNQSLLDEFSVQYNDFHQTSEQFNHKNAAKFGRSLLRELMSTEHQLLLNIISRVERERLAWDVLQKMVVV